MTDVKHSDGRRRRGTGLAAAAWLWAASAGLLPAIEPLPPEPPPIVVAPKVDEVLQQLRHSPRNLVALDQLKQAIRASIDDDRTALGLAVYCLAEASFDRMDEAEAAYKSLTARFPGSPYLKALSWQEISKPCPWCNGEGVRRNAPCERCNGARKCTNCRGKGSVQILSKRTVPCAACNGAGKCSACGGTGKGDVKCAKCQGRGRSIAYGRADSEYRALLKASGGGAGSVAPAVP